MHNSGFGERVLSLRATDSPTGERGQGGGWGGGRAGGGGVGDMGYTVTTRTGEPVFGLAVRR